MRKTLLFMVCCLLTVVGAKAQNSGKEGYVDWSFSDGTLTLTSNVTNEGVSKIAAEYYPWYHLKSDITKVEIKGSIVYVGIQSFMGYSNLTEIVLGQNCASIFQEAFSGCTNLSKIAAYRTYPPAIGVDAFKNVPENASITVTAGVKGAYAASPWGDYFTDLELATSGTTGDVNWEFSEGTLTISGEGAMDDTYKYPMDLPWYDFSTLITTGIIEDGVTNIAKLTFYATSSILTSVSIGKDVAEILASAFDSCSNLTEITLFAEAPPTLGDDVFYSVPTNIPVYVPAGKVNAYKDTDWNNFTNIKEIQQTGEAFWKLENNTLTIYGEGAMADYNDVIETPWYSFADNITYIVIESGVTSVGNNSFATVNFNHLTIGEDVTTIGADAFCDTDIEEMVIHAETPPTVAAGAFDDVNTSIPIYVPQGTKADYMENGSGWDTFTNILSIYTQIENIDDLKDFRDGVNKGVDYSGITVELTGDIDLEEENWRPIGTLGTPFKGTFDGKGYTISNLTILESQTTAHTGLFGVAKEATIKNLILDNVIIEANNASMCTGGLIGMAQITNVENCHITGESSISESTYSNNETFTGGLIGWVDKSVTVKLCSNNAAVSGSEVKKTSYIGGLIGCSYGTIDRCFNQGKITGNKATDFQYIGGLTGTSISDGDNKGSITNCYNIGGIVANANAYAIKTGGIVGSNYENTIQNCYSYADITGGTSADYSHTGGIVGSAEDSPITYCLALSEELTGKEGKTGFLYGYSDGISSGENYTWVKGADQSLYSEYNNGDLWSGSMNSAPIVGDEGWNSAIWDIDFSDVLMPKLNGLLEDIVQPDVKNPLKASSETPSGTYHTITLEVAPGIEMYGLSAGNHQITEDGHLHLQFLPEDPQATAEDILFLVDGVETSFEDFGAGHYFSYILNPISQDHTILIAMKEYTVTLPEVEGVRIDVGAGSHSVAYGEKFTFTLTLDDSIDPADVHVFANGIEIQPDALRATVLSYTIDKVINSIVIVIEGTGGGEVGNIAIAAGKIQIATDNGKLKVESDNAVDVAVYSISGKNVVSLRALRGSKTIDLQPGVYIVRAGTQTTKVIVNN